MAGTAAPGTTNCDRTRTVMPRGLTLTRRKCALPSRSIFFGLHAEQVVRGRFAEHAVERAFARAGLDAQQRAARLAGDDLQALAHRVAVGEERLEPILRPSGRLVRGRVHVHEQVVVVQHVEIGVGGRGRRPDLPITVITSGRPPTRVELSMPPLTSSTVFRAGDRREPPHQVPERRQPHLRIGLHEAGDRAGFALTVNGHDVSLGSHSRLTTRSGTSRVAGRDADDLGRREAEHADRRIHQPDEPVERRVTTAL